MRRGKRPGPMPRRSAGRRLAPGCRPATFCASRSMLAGDLTGPCSSGGGAAGTEKEASRLQAGYYPTTRVKTRGTCWLVWFVALPLAAQTAPPPATPPPTADDLYQIGKTLFDQLAPPEIKEQYEFPSKEQWDEFAARLQR